jgi:hypothetical protein
MRQGMIGYGLNRALLDSEQMDADPRQNEPRVCCKLNASNFHPVEVLIGAAKSQLKCTGYGLL